MNTFFDRQQRLDNLVAQQAAEILHHEKQRVIIVRLPYLFSPATLTVIRATDQWADAQARKIAAGARLQNSTETRQTELGIVLRRYHY